MAVDSTSLLTRLPGCANLGAEALGALARTARAETHPRGTKLVVEGDPAPDWYCLLESGAIQVSRAGAETEEVLDYLAAGDVLDPGSPGLPAAWSAQAVEAIRAVLVPQSAVARHRRSLAVGLPADYRADLELLVRRVADLVKGPPVTCPASASVTEAARLMTSRGVGSVVVVAGDGAALGIVTDRDLRSRVLVPGLPAATPVAAVMSAPVASLAPDRPAFDALLEMTRRGIHHLGVVDGGRLVGMVSSHDIVLLQGAHPVGLMRAIDGEGSLEGLAAVAPRVGRVVQWLAERRVRAHDIGRIAAELNDRLVHRALGLVVGALEAQGHGRPPLDYAWLAAGSEGRREQTLKTDQDNGLVYADPPDELASVAGAYFQRLATAMADALVRLGFPECEGGFMAKNPRWCRPESVWRGYFDDWMETPHPADLLHASLFFDMRPLAGDLALGDRLWAWVCERAASAVLFQRHMAKTALERHVPLGLFGGFVVERTGVHRDRLDLKARGIFPMTQAMRACALSLGVRETNTVDRLLEAGRRGMFTPTEVEDLRDAYEVIFRLRLSQQLACLDAGRAPDNFVDPRILSKADRLLLKQAFKALAWLLRFVEDRFHTEMVT